MRNNFITWGKLLYALPQAMVRTNSMNSEYFCLHRSTRQGCPFSPLLFDIVMELLSIALRSLPDIVGIMRNGVELKLELYADYFCFYPICYTQSLLPFQSWKTLEISQVTSLILTKVKCSLLVKR